MTQGGSSWSWMNPSSAPACSICLEAVVDNNGRSTARLRCGHVFHLDCIGSEFNIKGVMQCPNCRVTENGEWLFAAGGFLQSLIEENSDDEHYHIEMHPSGHQWCPINGFQEAPTLLGERMLNHNANSVNQEVFIVAGGSNPGPNHMHPWNGHQVAAGFPMPPPINDIHLHQHNWVTQAQFPSMDNTVNAANQALNSSAIFGVFSNRGPHAHPFIHGHGSVAGPRGFVGALSGSPYPGSNAPLTRFIIPHEQPISNSPSPAARTSMLARMRGSQNPGVMHQAGGFTMIPLSEGFSGNGINQVLLPQSSSGAAHVMQQGHASDGMLPENQTDGSGITMYQFF